MAFNNRDELSEIRAKINHTIDRVVDARFFGIVGAGDETSKLLDIRDYCLENDYSVIDFRKVPGRKLQSQTPRWLSGVQNVTLDLRGIEIIGQTAGWGYLDMFTALVMGSGSFFHDSQGTGQLNPANAVDGDIIEDAEIGDSVVTLSTSDLEYPVGTWCLIYGFVRQPGSFPPNPAAFEFCRVSSVSGDDITLDRPLKYFYRKAWPDNNVQPTIYDNTYGAARILPLDRPNYSVGKSFTVYGGYSRKGPQPWGIDTYSGALCVYGVLNAKIIEGDYEWLLPAMAQRVSVERSRFNSLSELDKNIEVLEAKDCDFNGLSQGTGITRVKLSGGSIKGEFYNRSPILEIDGVDIRSTNSFSPSAHLSRDSYFSERVSIVNSSFPDGQQDHIVSFGGVPAFTPDSEDSSGVTVLTSNPAFWTVAANTWAGSTIFDANGNYFEVTDVIGVAGGVRLLGSVSGSGQRKIVPVRSFFESGNVWRDNKRKVRFGGNAKLSPQAYLFTGGENYTPPVNRLLPQIEIFVIKPYTGSDALGQIQVTAGSASTVVDLKSVAAGHTQTLLVNAFVSNITFNLRGDAGVGAFTNNSGLPIVLCEVR